MADHQVVLLQEVAGHLDAFVQQAAGIPRRSRTRPLILLLAQLLQLVVQFLAGVLVELA